MIHYLLVFILSRCYYYLVLLLGRFIMKQWHQLGGGGLYKTDKFEDKAGQFWSKTEWCQLWTVFRGHWSRPITLHDFLTCNTLCTKCGIKLKFSTQITDKGKYLIRDLMDCLNFLINEELYQRW